MQQGPSFQKELLAMAWLLIKVVVPVAAWVGLCVLIGRHHLIAAELVLYSDLLLGIAVYFAYSNHKWKKRLTNPADPSNNSWKVHPGSKARVSRPTAYPDASRLPATGATETTGSASGS
jgi:hypothetical protein